MTTFGVIELRGGGARVTLAPAIGGRIMAFELGGRQWLWTNPDLPFGAPIEGASYAETGNSGGYDECFPTVAPCVLASGTPRYGGLALPDHGELWTQHPTAHFDRDDEGQRATCTWTGQRLPYRFRRSVQITRAGELRVGYAVENTGADPLPFLWSSQPMLPLTDATRLDLPTGALVRVADSQGSALRGIAAECRWPNVRLATRIADLAYPAAIARRYACKLFVDLPAAPVLLGVTEGPFRLDVRVDGREIPHVALSLNNGEVKTLPDGHAARNLALAPCIGAADTLTAAIKGGRHTQWIPVGGRRTWSVTWAARRLDEAPA